MKLIKNVCLLQGVMLLFVIACKKESAAPVSIYGKWYVSSSISKLYNSSHLLVDSVVRTKFTSDDFVAFGSDGSGYFSSYSAPAPSLSTFRFTINGKTLTQTTSGQNLPFNGTVTNLTATNLSIHTEYAVADPNSLDFADKEIDDISYHR